MQDRGVNQKMYAITSFLSYSAINAFAPGPGNLLALSTVVGSGWKKGKRLLLGIFAGYYAVQIICVLLVYSMEYFMNPVIGVMKYIGCAYILWLIVHIIRSKPDFEERDKKPSFWTGFILQFVNVKVFLLGITALTGYIIPFNTSFAALLLSAIAIATIGTIATMAWAFLGTLFQKKYIRHFCVINIFLALALLGCAVSLLIL